MARSLIVVGVAYFVTAWGGLEATRLLDGEAILWPATGVALLGAIGRPRRQRFAATLAVMVAALLANWLFTRTLWLSIGFTLADGAGLVLATECLVLFGNPRARVATFAEALRAVIAVMLGSLASVAVAMVFTGETSGTFVLSWVVSDVMGALTVGAGAIVVAGLRLAETRRYDARFAVDLTMLAVFNVVLCAIVFGQNRLPILFLPLVGAILTTFRLGTLGAATAMLTISVIGATLTALGHGPLTLMPSSVRMRIYFFETYLLIDFATVGALALLLRSRDELVASLRESDHFRQLAEQAARIGYWRFDAKTWKLFGSEELCRMHGLPAGTTDVEAYYARYTAADRARLEALVERALTTHEPFACEVPITVDGAMCWTAHRAWMEQGVNGRWYLFGVTQDISESASTRHTLEQARDQARVAADAAQALVDTDQLTGAASRRRTMALLGGFAAEAAAGGGPFSAVMVDLDHFKNINDHHGHATGDEILTRVVRAAQATLRGGDVVGRLGGEEFVILLPGADERIAMAVAERVRLAVEADRTNGIAVTISSGVATLVSGESADALLARADEALYAAKHAGRNRLHLAA